ncbi:MAG: SLC13 family permease [Bryobacterales bacterium]|nr:SLC13 family permease [Bryobacterales bacterium]
MALHPLVILSIAIAVVFVLILRLRINAFIALITAATTVGILSPNVGLGEVMPSVAGEFGGVCASIAIVIALAALIGQCLMESGAADKIVRVFVRALGEKHASLSLLSSGYVLSVPVFFDTVFYLLVPLARAMRVRMGKHYLLFLMAISAGGAVTHSMVPPTPGPLAMAATLGIDLGVMILVGAMIAVPMSVGGWLFGILRDRQLDVPLRETQGLTLDELEDLAKKGEERLPSFFMAMLPIVLPVILIASNTLVGALGVGGVLGDVTSFLGNPNLALLASAAISLMLLAKQKGYTLAQLAGPVETSLASGGLIILITAAGGSFGKMLVRADVGKVIGDMSQEFGVPLLLLSFLLGTLLKVAQGSGTVAMITVSAIMAPLVIDTPPGFHTVYVACAIGSGSLVGSWMNDSGFWVYKQMSGLTETEALQTWTPLLAVMGVIGYIVTQIAALILPLA